MEIIKDKNILITGGAGSFGGAILDEILEHDPKVVRVYDNSEESLFELKQRLAHTRKVRYLVGDVRDEGRLKHAMENIDIVFHAAALKHVESCEYNPFEAVKTNVIGTQNIIDVTIREEPDKVIFTSSDKATNPTNVMGTSKLLAEKLFVAANVYKGDRKTVYSSVRFGNVLGSSGSVVPLFTKQIEAGGPVTVTDPDMTRFMISLGQAMDLVIKSAEMAHGGEVFILKMDALRLGDLAEVMIEELAPKFGRKPEDIEVKVIGSKAGEKDYEELMTEEEARRSLETDDLFIILPQLDEVKSIERGNYADAKKTPSKSFNSRDSKLLSKEGVKKLLANEGLL